MCVTAAPPRPSAPPPGLTLRRSADHPTGWFYHCSPTPWLLPESPRQFRLSRIEGPEPTRTPVRQEEKPTRRTPALPSPPELRPAGEFGPVETAQNATPPWQLGRRQCPRPETESP